MPESYFEKSDNKSHKFYEVLVNGCQVKIIYGRIGSGGRVVSKTFASVCRINDQ